MSTWLAAWRNRDSRGPKGPVMELQVVAGVDAGNQFTLEGDAVLVGRGQPATGQTDVVRLLDKSISRRQAWIRRDAAGTSIEHIPTAANPTLVNGSPVSQARLSVGDRIEMGHVAIEVRAREGINLRGLTEIMENVGRDSTTSEIARPRHRPQPAPNASTGKISTQIESESRGATEGSLPPAMGVESTAPRDESTEVRPMEVELGELQVFQGVEGMRATRFPIGVGTTSIGRSEISDVYIPDRGISRNHAEIEIAGRNLVLFQRSETNQTLVNGLPVVDQIELRDGDEIQLADRVVLGVRLIGRFAEADRPPGFSSQLSQRMENKIDLDRKIEEFNVMGTFLDVDVVSSRTMKGGGEKAEHIIVSFERFRAYVSGICEEWHGQVLNCNGDELMCFFESAASALMAGSAILERLDAFNREQNLLSRDFSFRLGAHTGVSLVDLNAGIAYSDVLDTAGHIQKKASSNTLWISAQTLESVQKELPMSATGELEGGEPLYRLDRFLRPGEAIDHHPTRESSD